MFHQRLRCLVPWLSLVAGTACGASGGHPGVSSAEPDASSGIDSSTPDGRTDVSSPGSDAGSRDGSGGVPEAIDVLVNKAIDLQFARRDEMARVHRAVAAGLR